MAFVDEVTIHATAGKGGNGVVHWLRSKETARGGPDGGDGGNGGDVVLVGVRDLSALAYYRHEKEFYAENGGAGAGRLKHGANGTDAELKVPVGTVAHVAETGDEYEITQEGERVTVFKGGWGGRGNAQFKSSTNQNPFQQTDGKPGEGGELTLTLKLIADVGLVGLPNAGKSSLLNALTRAKSKTGDYPFTTLEPSLGSFYGHVIADIPGLIEGASSGRGLGIRFLKHVERTGMLLHLVSASQEDPFQAYKEVRHEIESFNEALKEKKELIVLSKVDLVSEDECVAKQEELEKASGKEVLLLSVEEPERVKLLSDRLTRELNG